MVQRANFTREQVAAACRQFGPTVGPLPAGVDGTQLLWALAGVESSFGANCQPRHEPAYDVGGRYATSAPMPTLLGRLGSAAACSYGPLQLMYCEAPLTYTPGSFDDIALAMQASVAWLNRLLRIRRPQTFDEVGECWNCGKVEPDPVYVQRLEVAHATPMPAAS